MGKQLPHVLYVFFFENFFFLQKLFLRMSDWPSYKSEKNRGKACSRSQMRILRPLIFCNRSTISYQKWCQNVCWTSFRSRTDLCMASLFGTTVQRPNHIHENHFEVLPQSKRNFETTFYCNRGCIAI